VPEQSRCPLYADHIEQNGIDLFRVACERDLEGVVAKWKLGAYGQSCWKIRNPNYSQYAGRRELFEKRAASATGSVHPFGKYATASAFDTIFVRFTIVSYSAFVNYLKAKSSA
jgi:hypothetical protein